MFSVVFPKTPCVDLATLKLPLPHLAVVTTKLLPVNPICDVPVAELLVRSLTTTVKQKVYVDIVESI